MAAPTTAVEVCNLALDHLDIQAITAIDPAVTDDEVVCARWYDQMRRVVLRRHIFNFSVTRVLLAKNSTDPTFGYSHAYDLPSDYIRLVTIGNDSIADIRTKYQVENGQLLLNNSSDDALSVRYVFDITDVTKFDSLYMNLLGLELALAMAFKFKANEQRVKDLREQLKKDAPEAYAVDGQERPPQRIQRSRFLQARRSSRTSSVASPFTIFEN